MAARRDIDRKISIEYRKRGAEGESEILREILRLRRGCDDKISIDDRIGHIGYRLHKGRMQAIERRIGLAASGKIKAISLDFER